MAAEQTREPGLARVAGATFAAHAVGTRTPGIATPVRSEIARASSRRPREPARPTDSGILKYASGNSVNRGSAPIQNMPRQPMMLQQHDARAARPSGCPAARRA